MLMFVAVAWLLQYFY